MDELCIPAFVGADEKGDSVDDSVAMSDCVPIA
jgi:hypothetical protein